MVYIAQNKAMFVPQEGANQKILTTFTSLLRDNRKAWSSGSYYMNHPNNWLFPTEHERFLVAFRCDATIYDNDCKRLDTEIVIQLRPRVLFLSETGDVTSVEGWVDVLSDKHGLRSSLGNILTTFRNYSGWWSGHGRKHLFERIVIPRTTND